LIHAFNLNDLAHLFVADVAKKQRATSSPATLSIAERQQ
jgi:hypothetical protein